MKNEKDFIKIAGKLVDDTKTLRSDIQEKSNNLSAFYFTIIGLCGGQFLGLTTNVLHDSFKKFGNIYSIIVSFLTILFLLLLARLFQKQLNSILQDQKKFDKRMELINQLEELIE